MIWLYANFVAKSAHGWGRLALVCLDGELYYFRNWQDTIIFLWDSLSVPISVRTYAIAFGIFWRSVGFSGFCVAYCVMRSIALRVDETRGAINGFILHHTNPNICLNVMKLTDPRRLSHILLENAAKS